MALIAISTIHDLPRESGLIAGWALEKPEVGTTLGGNLLEIAGWVVGRSHAAVAVELLVEGRVVRRAALCGDRQDVAAAHPHAPQPWRSAFQASVSVAGLHAAVVELRAVLANQQRVPLARVEAHRRWREESIASPLVSVIIPCYRQAHFLSETIESALRQNYPHVDILVVDDGSPDNVSAIAASYPGVRYLRQPNAGVAAARNIGIQHSRGELLAFLDSDDRLLPGALEAGLEALTVAPSCGCAVGRYRLIALDGRALAEEGPAQVGHNTYTAMLQRNPITIPAQVLFRRSVFAGARGFRQAIAPAEDYDLYLRIAREAPIAFHDTLVAEYRRHGENSSLDSARMLRATTAALRAQKEAAFERRATRRAYRRGMRYWRRLYGAPLVESYRAARERGEWCAALRSALALARGYPRGLLSALTGAALPTEPALLVEKGQPEHALVATLRAELARRRSAERVAVEAAEAAEEQAAALRKALDAARAEADQHKQAVDERLAEYVRLVARQALPPGATALVISRGDEHLVDLDGREGWHFPRGADGEYAGYYPADGASALDLLRQQQAMGAGYLVIPSPAFWWLDYYAELRQHLEQRHRQIWDDSFCIIYQLAEASRASRPRLAKGRSNGSV